MGDVTMAPGVFFHEEAQRNGMLDGQADKPAAGTNLAAGEAILPRNLGELLLENGVISEQQLADAAKVRQTSGGFIGQILVQLHHTTQEAISSCLVKHCRIPHLSLLDYNIGPQVLGLVPAEICKKYGLVPIDKLGRILTVAMIDPLDAEAIDAVRQACPELRIKPILCNWEHFEMVARRVFSDEPDTPAGQASVSMKSLGLKAIPAAVPAPPAKLEVPPPTSSVAMHPSPVSSGVGAAELTAAVTLALQDALAPMREIAAALQRQMSSPAAPSLDSFGGVLQNSMRQALQEVLQARDSIAPTTGAAAPPVNFESLASLIHDGVEAAMEDALSTFLVHMRADTGKPEVSDSALAEMMREMRNDTVHTLREILESNHSLQAEQQTRLSEIAEAVLQGVQEGALKGGNSPALLVRPSASPVTAFPSGVGQAQRTSEQEQQDAQVVESLLTGHAPEELVFDNFLPGAANEFPFKLGKSIAAAPGTEYNPFFIYGKVGVGKTHLITAIGNAIRLNKSGLRVGYISASHFAQRLTEALKARTTDDFRQAHCRWDVLILDDIQFLGGRVEAQEEFFHVFNVLHQAGRQIIIAADKPPERLGLLEKRLISRFGSGIVAELRPPEYSTRLAILLNNVQHAGQPVPEDVLSMIASRVPNDVRRMTGALKKVMAFAKLVKADISCEMVSDILSHMQAEEAA